MDYKDERLGEGKLFPGIEPQNYAQKVFEEMPQRTMSAKRSTPMTVGEDILLGDMNSDKWGKLDSGDKWPHISALTVGYHSLPTTCFTKFLKAIV